MPSAAIWLDELGIPPREVCLDWAWQIQTQFANTRHSVAGEAAALHWQRIEVSDTGELLLPSDLQNYSPDARLQELLNWAQGEDSSTTRVDHFTVGKIDVEPELRKLIAKSVTGASSVTGSVRDSSQVLPRAQDENSSQDKTLQMAWVAKYSKPQKTHLRNQTRTAVSSLNSNSVNRVIVALKQRRVVASIVSVVLIAGCIFALSPGTGKINSSNPIELSRETEAIRGNNQVNNSSSELDESAALAVLPEIPQLGLSEPEVHDISQITMPSVSNALIGGLDRKALNSSASVGVSNGDASEEAMPKESEPSASHSAMESANASELAERDIMQELEVLTKSAANNEVVTDLEVSNTMVASTVSEPFMLQTSPMVQIHKLAAKIKVRPRQPVWQILLSVDDDFELTPEVSQDISDRQITTWLLADSDSKSPKVRLVIQVQAAPGRQTALRWRIFAGAEDLPDLMLPLDKEILHPLQDRLRIYSQVSQREADRVKQLATSAERDVRAALSKQRAFMESQSKLASRLSTIVAEAHLLDDLLRSQLTVYAKLRDGTGSDAPTLLRFGDLSTLEKHDEESK